MLCKLQSGMKLKHWASQLPSNMCGAVCFFNCTLYRSSRLGCSRHYSLAEKEMGHHLAALPNGCGGQGDFQLPELNLVGLLCNSTL